MLRHVVPEIEAQNAANPGLPQTFCLLYESEGILGLDSARGIEFDLRRAADFAEHFRHLAREYFAHPAYYRIGGKPVVYLYLSRTFSGDYVTALSRASSSRSAHPGAGRHAAVGSEDVAGRSAKERS